MNEILLYGDIGPFADVHPAHVVNQLQALKGQPVTLRILSNGGDVFSGLAIYNYLRGLPNVTAAVDGLSASIASIVMLGASRVTMPENGYVMVHNPTGVVMGDSGDMKDLSDLLGGTGSQMASIYARETGQDEKTTQGWMSDETWFDAPQALAAGLIDEITEPVAIAAKAHFNLGRLTRTPTALLQQLTLRSGTGTHHMTKLLDALRALNVIGPGDTDEDTIAAKAREALTGLKSQRDALAELLKTGVQARAKLAVEAAVSEGRVSKENAKHFLTAYLSDEETAIAILASIPKPGGTGTSPVGFGGADEPNDRLAALQGKEGDPKKRLRVMQNDWPAFMASGAR